MAATARRVAHPALVLLAALALLAGSLPLALRSGADEPSPTGQRAATLSLDEPRALLPSAVEARGKGFPDDARGAATLEPGGHDLGAVRTSDEGRFTVRLDLPDVPTGDYRVTVAVGGTTASAPLRIGNPEGDPAALGAFVDGAPGKPKRLKTFERLVGQPPRIVMWYHAWGGENAAPDLEGMAVVAARGAMPMLTWEPWDPRDGVTQPDYRLAVLCTRPGSAEPGRYDPYIDAWADLLAAWKRPVLLRFAHEMNGTWYPWAAGVNDNTAGDYRAAWECLRERFAARGADNVRWVWSPNVDYPGATPLATLYPGDGQVDWVALDGYNWGTVIPEVGWKGFGEIFGPTLEQVAELSARPVMVGETASAEDGGSKAEWIRDALLWEIPIDHPEVRAVAWFQARKEADWRVNSSRSSLKAYREAARHPYWQGASPGR